MVRPSVQTPSYSIAGWDPRAFAPSTHLESVRQVVWRQKTIVYDINQKTGLTPYDIGLVLIVTLFPMMSEAHRRLLVSTVNFKLDKASFYSNVIDHDLIVLPRNIESQYNYEDEFPIAIPLVQYGMKNVYASAGWSWSALESATTFNSGDRRIKDKQLVSIGSPSVRVRLRLLYNTMGYPENPPTCDSCCGG
jgi:hypothetical protein